MMLGHDDGRWIRQAEDFFARAQRQHHQGWPALDGRGPPLLFEFREPMTDRRPLAGISAGTAVQPQNMAAGERVDLQAHNKAVRTRRRELFGDFSDLPEFDTPEFAEAVGAACQAARFPSLPVLNDRLIASLRCALWGCRGLGDPQI